MKIVGIIPARSGSKGVPNKNIKLLNGFPLMAYSIVASKQCKWIDETYLSSDSNKFLEIGEKFGAKPILRPNKFATDTSGDREWILHAIETITKETVEPIDYIVHLRPTTPNRDITIISYAISKFISDKKATSLRSAHMLSESPYKMFQIKNGYFKSYFDSKKLNPNAPRQSFPDCYHPDGYVDILDVNYILKSKDIHGNKILPFIVPEVVEIDTKEDFIKAEKEMINSMNSIYMNSALGIFKSLI